jgi:hypothetical protein
MMMISMMIMMMMMRRRRGRKWKHVPCFHRDFLSLFKTERRGSEKKQKSIAFLAFGTFLHTRHTRRTKTHYKNKNGSATVELFTGRG